MVRLGDTPQPPTLKIKSKIKAVGVQASEIKKKSKVKDKCFKTAS